MCPKINGTSLDFVQANASKTEEKLATVADSTNPRASTRAKLPLNWIDTVCSSRLLLAASQLHTAVH